jgi:hypothetical protein
MQFHESDQNLMREVKVMVTFPNLSQWCKWIELFYYSG